MQNTKTDPIMKAHFILMLLLCAVTGISLVFIIIRGISLPSGVLWVYAILFLSLLSGLLYVRKGYQKSAAIYYKALILLTAIADVVLVITTLSSRGFHFDIVMICARIILLLILVFGKDLGKRKKLIQAFSYRRTQ